MEETVVTLANDGRGPNRDARRIGVNECRDGLSVAAFCIDNFLNSERGWLVSIGIPNSVLKLSSEQAVSYLRIERCAGLGVGIFFLPSDDPGYIQSYLLGEIYGIATNRERTKKVLHQYQEVADVREYMYMAPERALEILRELSRTNFACLSTYEWEQAFTTNEEAAEGY
jgi:hypothetical protein